MTLPVTVPNTFANATTSIPLANLDANFVTIYGAVNGIGNGAEALANVNISGGTVANAAVSNTSVSATTLNTSGQVVFNDAGADVDFRVEGDTEANLLFVDASTDRVGVGTNAPQNKLHVSQSLAGSASSSNGIARIANTRTNTGDGAATLLFVTDEVDGSTQDKRAQIGAEYEGSNGGRLVLSTAQTSTQTMTERARFTSDGYLRMASGTGGIQFNGDTAAANALDDYEEGTYTPAWVGAGTPTYVANNTKGRYTKIGNTCVVWGTVSSSALTQSGNLVGVTLPFTVKNDDASYGSISIFPQTGFNSAGGAGNIYGLSTINTTHFDLYTIASGTGNNYTPVTYNDLQAAAGSHLRFCVVFEVA